MSRGPLSACLVVVALVAGTLAAGAVAAAQPAPSAAPRAEPTDAEAARLFREVMSPFCPGLTLADCPSPNAFTMRDGIKGRLAKGEPREAILDELVRTYGAQILSDPSDTPIGAVVWGVPFAVAALAALGLALLVRRATHRPPTSPAMAVAGSPGVSDRLDEELERLD